MLDHINLPVSNLTRSAQFYTQVLSVLDLAVLYEDPFVVGYGQKKWDFGIELEEATIVSIHVAFCAPSRTVVESFYNTAVNNGGVDNGAPGLRSEYGNGYFAAYILDFDGHNVEAVFRG